MRKAFLVVEEILAPRRVGARGHIRRGSFANLIEQFAALTHIRLRFHGNKSNHGLSMPGQQHFFSGLRALYKIGQLGFRLGNRYSHNVALWTR